MTHTLDTNLRFTSAANPVTSAYTCGAGATVLVVAVITGGSTARSGGNPTYNGITLTQAGSRQVAAASPETSAEMFYLVGPPTGSSLTINVPNAGTLTLYVQASSYKAQTGWLTVFDVAGGATGTSTNPASTTTIAATGELVVATVGSGATTWAPSARTGTQLNDTDDGAFGDGNQYLLSSTGTSQAMNWTFGTIEDWAICVGAWAEVPLPVKPNWSRNAAPQQASSW